MQILPKCQTLATLPRWVFRGCSEPHNLTKVGVPRVFRACSEGVPSHDLTKVGVPRVLRGCSEGVPSHDLTKVAPKSPKCVPRSPLDLAKVAPRPCPPSARRHSH